jgi:peptidyl-prolyl cis-trans isomerase SurA
MLCAGRIVKERMTEKQKRTNFQAQQWVSRVSQLKPRHIARRIVVAGAMSAAAVSGSRSLAQAPAKFQAPAGGFSVPSTLQLPALPTPTAITSNGSVVEDVVARVNDQIITRSEYEAAEEQLLHEAQQQNISQAEFDDRLRDLLRDMVDEQLLLSKGKELGITGDAETMRQLDDIRKRNNIASMEDLEKAAATQGVSFEDYKRGIRDQVIRQQVVRDEVGRRLNMTHLEETAYYDKHKAEFALPEQVHLSEILIPTVENPTEAQIAAAQAKADALAAKLAAGAKFSDLAKTSSGGPTAAAGGDLGDFKRGALGDVLEKATFSLPAGSNTAPIRTRQGFVILHVDSHQAAGVPPLSAVEDQVQQAMYFDELQPALRTYLTKARDDAYLEIAPGFVDTGSAHKQTKPVDIAYTAYKAPAIKKKNLAKQRIEQEKANKAQAELAAARERVAEKEAEKAASASTKTGVKNVSRPVKPKKIHREKIRYGQAPQKSLPAGTATAAVTTGGSLGGQAPGIAMAPTDSVTSITTGVGADPDADVLATTSGPQKKTRFAAHESEADEAAAKAKLNKAEAKATTRPVAAAPIEDATEKHQATPLGLNGDTVKKKKAPKRKKGEAKERLQEKPKPSDVPATVAPTVNPNLGGGAVIPSSSNTTTPPPQ